MSSPLEVSLMRHFERLSPSMTVAEARQRLVTPGQQARGLTYGVIADNNGAPLTCLRTGSLSSWPEDQTLAALRERWPVLLLLREAEVISVEAVAHRFADDLYRYEDVVGVILVDEARRPSAILSRRVLQEVLAGGPGVETRGGIPKTLGEPEEKGAATDGHEPADAPAPKTINAWIGGQDDEPAGPLRVGKRATLHFKVGQPVLRNLVDIADAGIPETDIPPEGLPTKWLVSSHTVRLAAGSGGASVTSSTRARVKSWRAQFALHIPKDGDSDVMSLQITPLTATDAGLDVVILARGEPYRQFRLDLAVTAAAPAPTPMQPQETPKVTINNDVQLSRADQLGLGTPHEWQLPPGTLRIFVTNQNSALVEGDIVECSGATREAAQVSTDFTWRGAQAAITGLIDNLRKAAERLRGTAETYLNDIDPADLLDRLNHFTPIYSWVEPPTQASPSHLQAWEEVRQRAELRELAVRGKMLYDELFPVDTELRGWLDCLEPGHRLHLKWTETAPGWVPGIPWSLLYTKNPDDPIDPFGFWGVRFRIHYTAHDTKIVRKNLGRPETTYRGHWMYWGGQQQDPTAAEARWQRSLWSTSPLYVFAPGEPPSTDPRQELRALLGPAKPGPMPVLYFFCQCALDSSTNEPVLRFGGTNKPADTLTIIGLPQSRLADRPLIFANACTTAAADPYIANELEKFFFRQGCSAFLGTETKVPIQFASRFATIFFHFFYRRADITHAPMAAGEAVAQSRLFLWTHYCNIGGILYTYINQYELFMADEAEIATLRR